MVVSAWEAGALAQMAAISAIVRMASLMVPLLSTRLCAKNLTLVRDRVPAAVRDDMIRDGDGRCSERKRERALHGRRRGGGRRLLHDAARLHVAHEPGARLRRREARRPAAPSERTAEL